MRPIGDQNQARQLRWRRAKGGIFVVVASIALVLALAVLVVLITTTTLEASKLTGMDAMAEAGIAMSVRAFNYETDQERQSIPYLTVSEITTDSSAEQSGINQYDAITSLNGEPLSTMHQAWRIMATAKADEDGKLRLPISWVPAVDRLIGELGSASVPGELGQYRASVKSLNPDSPAARAGLQEGDVLVDANDLPIQGRRKAWGAIVAAAKENPADQPIQLTIRRNGNTMDIGLDAELSGTLVAERNTWEAIWDFATSLDSPNRPERAGLKSALLGTIYIMLVMMVFAFPIGAMGAIYLEEYASKNVFTDTVQILIANLAGIPSVAYGIIGLQIFARELGMGNSVLAGGLTLGLVILPIMIIAARETLRAVPPWVREAAYGVGATRWQVIQSQVLPVSLPGMFTGMILSLAQAIGEAAPLILLGASLYVNYVPDGLLSGFTAVPLQIFSWVFRAKAGFNTVASVAILLLLVVMIILNALAIWLRNRYQKSW
ncbi:MAG: phosphate ABC transporter permease PstA [Candidatus Bipolaricaulia bacterium]